ncbi:hypothetical protein ZWY2020_012774 [Hordeum vulgare]|nr:hypothetical protein ZWY2020_012774 [Hordeum vulgare]
MVRYGDERISSAFNLANWLEIPTAVDLPPAGEFPPGWLDEWRRTLHEEMRPEKRGEPNYSRLFLVKLRVNLLTRGYVENVFFSNVGQPAARSQASASELANVDYTPPFPVSARGQTMDITREEDMGKFSAEVRRVALQLMEAILEGLGLGKHYQHDEFERGLQLLQVNCYPKEPEGESAIGLAPHSDHGFLTILLASCPGLEVLDRSTNTWRVVQQPRHVLHVHVGDLMEVLSNGRIKTVVHRAVLNPGEARISMASIHSFVMHEKVSVAKELVDEQDPEKYKESSFSDFLDYVTSNVDKKRMSFLDSLRM